MVEVVGALPAPDPLWPLHRPELGERLAGGERRIAGLFRATPRMTVAAQTHLLGQHQPHDLVFWLHAGWACRYRRLSDGRRQVLGIYLPGDLMGTDAVVSPYQRHTIETMTPCVFHCVPQDILLGALAEPDAALWFTSVMMNERERMDSRATWLGRCNAEQRVASLLLELFERLHRLQIVNGRSFVCPLTQQDLADCVGITIVHANRVLARFHANGVATMQSRNIAILDLERLQKIASAGQAAAAPARTNGATKPPP